MAAFRQAAAEATAAAAGFIAALRESIGVEVDHPRFVELVGELSLTSGRFRQLWARHDVRPLKGGTTTVHHPVLGRLHLHRDKLPVDGVLLVLHYADTGSDSAEKLSLLASLTSPVSAEPFLHESTKVAIVTQSHFGAGGTDPSPGPSRAPTPLENR